MNVLKNVDKKNPQRLESSLKNLRIADVELFITAAHFKSLGKSATFHHLSQSAASTAIQRVEAAFGIPLCTHEKRQFTLTREGQLYLPCLENWVNDLRSFIVSQDRAPIRLVTTHAIAGIAIPALLSLGHVEFTCMRPDLAYAAILRDEADIALVLDNATWRDVVSTEVGRGDFQLYSRKRNAPRQPVLLPEDQMEVLALQQRWQELHGGPIPIQSRIPSWSLIATICATSEEVGFLPNFLAKAFGLHPVSWQPAPSPYRILAIYRKRQNRFGVLIEKLREAFHFIPSTITSDDGSTDT